MRVEYDENVSWKDCESVVVRFPWFSREQGEVYTWLLFNLSPQGTTWEQSTHQRPPLEVEFLFADPKHATLFALRWGHLIVS